jgi:hypothetical protein
LVGVGVDGVVAFMLIGSIEAIRFNLSNSGLDERRFVVEEFCDILIEHLIE